MNIQILSDLHIEFGDFKLSPGEADVVILAGDIHTKGRGVQWAIENIPDKPVLYVLGNHEFYGKAYPKHIDELKAACAGTNVQVLEQETVTIDGVNFMGCTLWTDFELFGNARVSGYECQQIMSDYKKIKLSPKYSKFRSIDVAAIHRRSRQWLEAELEQHAGHTNVVITHHAPSPKSLPPGSEDKVTNAAYVSQLDPMIESYLPHLWLHGHLHSSSDYLLGDCRVVCNPRGYPDSLNSGFDENLLIEL